MASPTLAAAPQVAAATDPTGLGRAGIGLLLLSLLGVGMGTPLPAHAAGPELLNMGVRVRIDDKRVLGEQQPESFRALDLSAQLRLRWQHVGPSGWHFGTRLVVSAGLMRCASQPLIVSATPVVMLVSDDGRYTVDTGLGLALLSNTRRASGVVAGRVAHAGLVAAAATPSNWPLKRRVGCSHSQRSAA